MVKRRLRVKGQAKPVKEKLLASPKNADANVGTLLESYLTPHFMFLDKGDEIQLFNEPEDHAELVYNSGDYDDIIRVANFEGAALRKDGMWILVREEDNKTHWLPATHLYESQNPEYEDEELLDDDDVVSGSGQEELVFRRMDDEYRYKYIKKINEYLFKFVEEISFVYGEECVNQELKAWYEVMKNFRVNIITAEQAKEVEIMEQELAELARLKAKYESFL